MKLFKIILRGYSIPVYYVVSKDPTSAYELIRKLLEKNDWYFGKDRELKSIEQVARENPPSGCSELFIDMGMVAP